MTNTSAERISEACKLAVSIYLEQGLQPAFAYCNSLKDESSRLSLITTEAVCACQKGFFAGEKAEKARTQSYIGALIEIHVKSETRMPLESEPVKRDPQSLLRRLDTMPTIDPEGFRPGMEG